MLTVRSISSKKFTRRISKFVNIKEVSIYLRITIFYKKWWTFDNIYNIPQLVCRQLLVSDEFYKKYVLLLFQQQ